MRCGDSVGGVFIFDGNITEALTAHVGQPVYARMSSFIFFGLSDHIATATSGTGNPLRTEILIDVYVVVRASGASRYLTDRERLNDICDIVIQDTFCGDCTALGDNYRANINATSFDSRSRRDTGDAVLSHLIRYRVSPKDNL